MRVTFLGTGTSTGIPVIGCTCKTCRSTDVKDKRRRPSIYIQFDEGPSVLVDASPDLRDQALQYRIERVDLILLTHSHADHVLGLDDVRIYNFRQRGSIPCQGDKRTLRDVRRMFAYVFDPETPKGGGIPQLNLFPVTGPFSFSQRTFIPVPLKHGTLPILGYRVGAFAYLTDCNEIPESSLAQLNQLDVLVLDALRYRPHSTHFSLDEAVQMAVKIGARQTYFTHMTHDLLHADTCKSLPSDITLAYDGLVVEVDDETPIEVLNVAAHHTAAML